MFVLVPTDAEDNERLAGEVSGDLFDVRQLFEARDAPGCPEVDEDDAAVHLVEVEAGAVERRDGEGWGHLLEGEVGVFGEAAGATVAGIVRRDGGEAGLELGAGGFDLAEVDEYLSV